MNICFRKDPNFLKKSKKNFTKDLNQRKKFFVVIALFLNVQVRSGQAQFMTILSFDLQV